MSIFQLDLKRELFSYLKESADSKSSVPNSEQQRQALRGLIEYPVRLQITNTFFQVLSSYPVRKTFKMCAYVPLI